MSEFSTIPKQPTRPPSTDQALGKAALYAQFPEAAREDPRFQLDSVQFDPFASPMDGMDANQRSAYLANLGSPSARSGGQPPMPESPSREAAMQKLDDPLDDSRVPDLKDLR